MISNIMRHQIIIKTKINVVCTFSLINQLDNIKHHTQVVELCKTYQVKSVADFGASELTFIQYLKNLDFVNQIYAVDIDQSLLESHKFKCKPLIIDYLNKRSEPLNISVLSGSVLECEDKLKSLDFICCIELIEHLQPNDVEQLSENLFRRLRPKFVVITTPNKDFNELFEFTSTQMRHWDHKFEWSREEFDFYCQGIKKYGYEYSLFGVGDPPEEHKHLGSCSQGALFTRSENIETPNPDNSTETCQTNGTLPEQTYSQYTEIYSVDYPIADPTLTPDHHLTNELVYQSRNLGQHQYLTLGEDDSEIAIELLQTFSSVAQYNVSDEHIAHLVEQSDLIQLSADGRSIVVRNVPDSPDNLSDSQSDTSDFLEPQVELGVLEEEPW